jgi:hypothetical protein
MRSQSKDFSESKRESIEWWEAKAKWKIFLKVKV